MALLLGIDIGTSSTKGVLVTPEGKIVAAEQVSHTISLPRPGWAEVDAETVWWVEVQQICRRLSAHAGEPIVGVSISGVGPSLVVCDAQIQPLRPAILYGIDTRASAEIDQLNLALGPDEILASCGKSLTSQALGPKLAWVRNHEPDVWRRTQRWYGCHSFVIAKLTGEYVMDHQTASQCDPLYRTPSFGWHHDWAMEICAPLKLPRLAWPSEVVGTVHASAAEETGLPIGTPVVAGTIDAFAEAFSVGVRQPGDTMIMYGSTLFVAQLVDTYRVHPTLWTTAGVDPGTHALAGGTATAGSLTTWFQSVSGEAHFSELMAEASRTPPGSEGLLVVPYLAGERSPVFDPQARGIVAGLTLRHSRGHLFRAVYEGIAFGLRHLLETFAEAYPPGDRVVAVGGGLHSPLWTSIMSDVTGRSQLIPREAVGACYGDGLLAAIGTGLVEPDTDWTVLRGEIVPNEQHRELYDALYETWLELYPTTRKTMHRLGEIVSTFG